MSKLKAEKEFDLTAILFEQRRKPRGDELEAHAADLYGCDRATWYRRRGLKPLPFTQTKLAQFAIGHGYEAEVRETLTEAGMPLLPDGIPILYLGLTGHPDIVPLSDAPLIEVKTTELVTPKAEVSPHYAVQAAFYALALSIKRAVVLVKHARSHIEKTYPVHPEDYRALIERRAAEVLARTAPTAPEPPAQPNDLAPWGCKYCEWAICERNPGHED